MEVRLATDLDLPKIINLQKENNFSRSTEEEGFVGVEMSLPILKEINQDGIFVAGTEKSIAGYAMPLTENVARRIPIVSKFVDRLDKLKFKGKAVSSYKWVISGQMLIDKKFRGTGLAEKLWKNYIGLMKREYEVMLAEIPEDNQRMLSVFTKKLKFEVIETYSSHGKKWHILAVKI
jgi:hypothetical protein